MKTDIEIAREARLVPIKEVADRIGISEDLLEPYGKYIAKVPCKTIDQEKVDKSNLILVTAITPTKAGIGKTTVSIGLALGLNKIGKNAIVALREPSLGPCFGMKGGAAGGGYAQVLPMDRINLHFTGDFHAITSAHNMITALLDNHIYQHREDGFAMSEVLWKRVLDINDRNLRSIVTGLGRKTDGVVMDLISLRLRKSWLSSVLLRIRRTSVAELRTYCSASPSRASLSMSRITALLEVYALSFAMR